MKETIHNLRFGLTDVKVLSDDDIVKVLEYCLSPDVVGILSNEILRRRTERLHISELSEKKRTCKKCGWTQED